MAELSTNAIQTNYMAQVRQKRIMNTILLIVFIALMVGGFATANDRNAGGFMNGLPMLLDFPHDVIGEAYSRIELLPGYFVKYLPSLIETVNIAGASTLLGGLLGLEIR